MQWVYRLVVDGRVPVPHGTAHATGALPLHERSHGSAPIVMVHTSILMGVWRVVHHYRDIYRDIYIYIKRHG